MPAPFGQRCPSSARDPLQPEAEIEKRPFEENTRPYLPSIFSPLQSAE
jgi:hypothetical protein